MCAPSGIRGAGTAHEPHRHVFSTQLRTPGRHADDPPLYSPASTPQAAPEHGIGPCGLTATTHRAWFRRPDRRIRDHEPSAVLRQACPMTDPATDPAADP